MMTRDMWYWLIDDHGNPAFSSVGMFFVTITPEANIGHFTKKVWEENQRIIDGVAAQLKVFTSKDDAPMRFSAPVGDRGASEDSPLFVVVPKNSNIHQNLLSL
ncbi:hypothetical protein HDU83_001284, partial [Entophlyctis luteolus]